MKEENKGTVIVTNSIQLESEAESSDLEVKDFSIDESNGDKDIDPVESSDSSLGGRESPLGNSSPESELDSNTLADRGVIIAGDPDSCIKAIKMYEEIGVDEVMMIMQTETIPHEKVMSSIELFGKEVFPAIRKTKTAKI